MFGTRRLNAIAGVLPAGVSREAAEQTAINNLRQAAPLAEQAGVMLLVENINTTDMPGYFADTAERAAALVQAVDRPNVRLQLDQYHVGMMGGDPRGTAHVSRDRSSTSRSPTSPAATNQAPASSPSPSFWPTWTPWPTRAP